MAKYAYFPGCSADSTGISFAKSADFVTKKIGIELVEIPDWCCCGTSAALVTGGDLAVALPARSLALAEKMDPTMDVATGCAGCFSSLKSARHFARQSEENRRHVEDLIEMPYSANPDVFSFLEIMSRPENQEAIKAAQKTTLHGLKVASYYGCALVRPATVCEFDDVENPQSMDNLMELVGAKPVEWGYKVECCGASHNISEPKAAKKLTECIYEDAILNGAEAIAVACPLCFLNLDMREKELNAMRAKEGKSQFNIPTYYFTELLGLTMGGKHKELGIDKHFWPAEEVAENAVRVREVVPAINAAAIKKPAAKVDTSAETAVSATTSAETQPAVSATASAEMQPAASATATESATATAQTPNTNDVKEVAK
jgi:heterodisulfide reductase subunit B